jgi:ParB-like chromosome segregation protein Spo0J
MTTTERPARYSIEGLLNSGIQPLPDLDDDALRRLGRAIGQDPLADPVSVSSDGILLDGHQRLKAMLKHGRKFIDASAIHVVEQATKDNALEYAVRLNVQRRHMTVEMKADLARQLQSERQLSQATIAKWFGVSRPAVSQWLSKTADADDESPSEVIGEDGKVYSPPPRSRERKEKKERSPWQPGGYAFVALRKIRKLLETEPVGELNALHSASLQHEIEDVISAGQELLAAMGVDD